MKINAAFHVLIFLITVLTFNIPLTALAQPDSGIAEIETIPEKAARELRAGAFSGGSSFDRGIGAYAVGGIQMLRTTQNHLKFELRVDKPFLICALHRMYLSV